MKTLIQVSSLLFVFFISSCDFKEDYELPSWDMEASVPIAASSVSFDDLLGDTTLAIDTLGDKSLVFVYQKDLVEYNFDEIVELNTISINRSENLGDVDIDDVSFSDGAPLPTSYQILTGSPITTAYNGVITKTLEYNATDDFHSITFAEGTIEMTLKNEFSFDLSNINITVQAQEQDINFNFPYLSAGQTEIQNFDLLGKTLDGLIEVSVTNVDIPNQSNLFNFSPQDSLLLFVAIKDIEFQEADVILPNQELLNEDTSFVFDAGGALLDRVMMSNGEIKMDITSSLSSVLKFEYSIPKATKNGVPFSFYSEIPANGSINQTISLTDYEFDLTGQDGNQTNTIFVESFARIDSTGELVSISVNDGVQSSISIENIVPSAAWGFLGQDTIVESRETSFLDLSALKGDIDFEFVEVKMVTENNLGVAADLHVMKIESSSNTSIIELESPLLASPFTIAPGVESSDPSNPVSPTITEIIFDESNSNIDKIVESKPNSIAFDFEMVVNGDNNNQNDGFIYLDYGVSSELQIEIPVSMKASNMVMKDTVDVSLSVPEIITDGSFTIVVNNGFPFDAEIKMELMNNAGLLLETLESENIISASEVDIEGKTIASTTSVLKFPFEDLSVLLARTKKIGLEITLNTQPNDQFVKLYSDYSIDMTVIANFEKLISQTILE